MHSLFLNITKNREDELNIQTCADTYNESPLDQFEIRDLISLDAQILNNTHISLTNIGIYLIISVLILLFLSILSFRVLSNKNENLIIPNA